MCTSNASKPARSNAAAISTCPFTPCSRSIATRGRAPVAMNGAAGSSCTIEREQRHEPGIVAVESARIPGPPPRDCRACAASRASSPTTRDEGRRAIRRAPSFRHGGCTMRPPLRPARRSAWRRRQPRAQRASTSSRSASRTCTTAPSSSANSAASTVAAPVAHRDVEAAARCERHFGQRDEQAAVADVVIREEPPVGMQPLHQREEAPRCAASSTSGASSPSWP